MKTRSFLNNYEINEHWIKVIELFEKRIMQKFLDPIKLLIETGNNEGCGFSIVAIECLLIETFAAFRVGSIYNNRYSEINDPPYQYKDCQKLFVNFLLTNSKFKEYFTESQTNNSKIHYSANEFYTDVRCGLLHEGRTKNDWTINLKKKEEIKGIFGKDKNKKKIYRTILYNELKDYLDSYIKELKEEKSKELRRNFARKMDNLYNFKPNSQKFEWWKKTASNIALDVQTCFC